MRFSEARDLESQTAAANRADRDERHARFNDEGPRYAGVTSTEPMPSAREAARDEAELGGE